LFAEKEIWKGFIVGLSLHPSGVATVQKEKISDLILGDVDGTSRTRLNGNHVGYFRTHGGYGVNTIILSRRFHYTSFW